MGDGVNIAAQMEGIAKLNAICLSEEAHWPVKGRLDLPVTDLGPTQLKNIAEPIRVYSFELARRQSPRPRRPQRLKNLARHAFRSSSCRSPTSSQRA
jgi:adenylate cyclase